MHHAKNTIWKCDISLTVAVFMALPGAAFAATVDEIVAKYIEATGGRAAQEAVSSALIEADASIVDFGLEMKVVIYYKNGNYKQVVEIPDIGEIIEGVTGDVAWTMNPMEGDAILEGEAAEIMRNQASLNPLLDWKERYASAEVTGEENGATIVVFKSQGGTETTCYFDNASGLLTKQEGKDPSGNPTTTLSSDYEKVGDITVAHTLVIETVQGNIDSTITATELNAEIDDGTFDLPEAIVALQAGEAPAGITAEQVMAMMDSNGDGKISMDEAPEQLQTSFAMVDQNGDEGIDVTEAQLVADFINNQ